MHELTVTVQELTRDNRALQVVSIVCGGGRGGRGLCVGSVCMTYGWGAKGIGVYCSMGIIVWAFGVRVFVCCRESESEIELFWAPV